ncbi:hypothetical protein [Herbaspirillum sp. ST 5-3]|uniref:hypothetical protein n=1 Tax=Oxalobacteraceae TaxID=75682 RepID=UPI0010A46A3C|nr:hypothetical protein [Herbaspirillum sp. ST 5-3]
MLILQVAFGIVLAVIILRLLPAIVAGALIIGLAALLAITAGLVWLNLKTVAIYIAAFGAVGLLYGIPFWLKGFVVRKYPDFHVLIKGEPPYDATAKQPLRIVVMACFSVAVASVGIGALLGAVYSVDLISQVVGK